MAASVLPVSDAASEVFGGMSGTVVTLLALLSVAAISNLSSMKSSRVAFALARQGALPEALSMVSGTGVPRVALVCTTAAAAAFALTGSYLVLIAIAAPFNMLVNGSVASRRSACAPWSRNSRAHIECRCTPYRRCWGW